MSEARSEAERLAKVLWKLGGIKDCVDRLEEFFEPWEQEMIKDLITIVIERVNEIRERSKS